jgi:hypothetical protein
LFSEHDEHLLDFYEDFQALGEAFTPQLSSFWKHQISSFLFFYVSFAFQVRDTQHSLGAADSRDNLLKPALSNFL